MLMLKRWFYGYSRKTRSVMIAVFCLIVVAMISFFVVSWGSNIPTQFKEGRDLASLTAKDIVSLLDETSSNLKEIKSLEQKQDWRGALNIVYSEIEKNKTVSKKALELTNQLEKMARAIPEIEPASARETAIVAISSEVALVTTLNSYINGDLNELLNLLTSRLTGMGGDYLTMNKLISSLNTKKDSINSMNDQFVKLMENFDKIYK